MYCIQDRKIYWIVDVYGNPPTWWHCVLTVPMIKCKQSVLLTLNQLLFRMINRLEPFFCLKNLWDLYKNSFFIIVWILELGFSDIRRTDPGEALESCREMLGRWKSEVHCRFANITSALFQRFPGFRYLETQIVFRRRHAGLMPETGFEPWNGYAHECRHFRDTDFGFGLFGGERGILCRKRVICYISMRYNVLWKKMFRTCTP